MIYALATWQDGELLVIKAKHMRDAILDTEMLLKNASLIANYAFSTPETAVLDKVRDLICGEGRVSRSRLLALATRRGVRDGKHLDQIVETLKQMGLIKAQLRRPKSKGGRMVTDYVWQDRKMFFKEEDSGEEKANNPADARPPAESDLAGHTPVPGRDSGRREGQDDFDDGSGNSA